MKLRLVAVIVLAAIGAGAILYSMGVIGASAASKTEYLTSPAAVGDVTEQIAATGTIASQTRTATTFGIDPWTYDDSASGPTSPATYPVAEVKVKVGDTVAAGDVLATADTSALKRDLAAAKNDLLSAKDNLRIANTTLDNATTTAAKRQARINRYGALNQVATAKQAVKDLERQIADATLKAPVAGLVTVVDIAVGADAPAGAAVVIDAPTYEVTTDVVESDLADVKLGQEAAITVSAVDADLTGTVTDISPIANADSGSGVVSFPVTVTLTTAPATVRAGMSADVTITTASADNVLTVPAAALNGRDGNYSVRTLGADGTPVSTPVGVGLVTNTTAEITSGLTEGTAVVTGTTADRQSTTGTTGGFPGGGGVVTSVGGGQIPRQFRPGN